MWWLILALTTDLPTYGTSIGTDNALHDDENGYEHVTVLSPIDTPTLSVCEKLRELAPASDDTIHADLLDGLIVSLDLMHRRTDGKKYEKKLLVITDAASKINDASDVEPVVSMIQAMDVKLQIVYALVLLRIPIIICG
jgi:ATP-dependent DNA helicase 2 subunit 2